ncbi:MAG: cache domain-containing protein, partial [SAR324 cluster bacterium]|nr:cache domain-containing protein [SAR324 cluster bacterium]
MKKNKEKTVSSSFLQWISILVAITLAVLTLLDFHEKNIQSHQQMREDIGLRLKNSEQQLTQYTGQVIIDLHIISMHPDIINFDNTLNTNTVKTLNSQLDRNRLSEIHIFSLGTNQKLKPFKVFKKDLPEQKTKDIYFSENEEYSAQFEHLHNFSKDPSLETRFGSVITLCKNEKDFVVSLPISKDGQFVGMISGVIPVNSFLACIDNDSNKGLITLVNGSGQIVAGKNKNNEMARWFDKKLSSKSALELFNGISHRLEGADYTITTLKIKM